MYYRLRNGPIWTDHHQQRSSIITPCSHCYLPFGSSNRWLEVLYDSVCDQQRPLRAPCYITKDFLQMQWRFTGRKMDGDKDLGLLWERSTSSSQARPNEQIGFCSCLFKSIRNSCAACVWEKLGIRINAALMCTVSRLFNAAARGIILPDAME